MIYILYTMIATVIFALSFLIINRKTIGDAFVITKFVNRPPKYIDIRYSMEYTDTIFLSTIWTPEELIEKIKREGLEHMHNQINRHIKVWETGDHMSRKYTINYFLRVDTNDLNFPPAIDDNFKDALHSPIAKRPIR